MVKAEEMKGAIAKFDVTSPKVFRRKVADFHDDSSNLVVKSIDYSKQFCHVYAARINELREVLTAKTKGRWNAQIVKLSELEEKDASKCILIGTIYKHQQWKPSILRELSDDHQLAPPESRNNYCSDADVLNLEDEMLRIKLVGKVADINEIVNGVVCAVLGHENKDTGTFEVEDWCFPGAPIQKSPARPNSQSKLVLLSGLDLVNTSNDLTTELLFEWLSGIVGDVDMQEKVSSVASVLIAGDSVKSKDEDIHGKGLSEGKAQDATASKGISESMKHLDSLLSKIVENCAITLMPGKHDPSNLMLPQRPFHPLLLPQSSHTKNLYSVANPWIGKVDGRTIIGTSGQPIEDIIKTSGSTKSSPLDWLERTLTWRHLCPTAPDTLPAIPCFEKDLFIMKECPDIYFVGNMEKFETKLWKGEENQTVRLVCIPNFSITKSVLSLDLDSLDVEEISFGAC